MAQYQRPVTNGDEMVQSDLTNDISC
jgi:hypothetical protein